MKSKLSFIVFAMLLIAAVPIWHVALKTERMFDMTLVSAEALAQGEGGGNYNDPCETVITHHYDEWNSTCGFFRQMEVGSNWTCINFGSGGNCEIGYEGWVFNCDRSIAYYEHSSTNYAYQCFL